MVYVNNRNLHPMIIGTAQERDALVGKTEDATVFYDRDTKKHYTYDASSRQWKEGNPFKSGEGGDHPYLSLERRSYYLYDVTYGELPEYKELEPVYGGCSSYVQDGKLYRNLDWDYSELASFHMHCADFEGMAFLSGLTSTQLDDERIGQLPYHVCDGVNNHGIMVATHVLYNDWNTAGSGDIPLTKLPYLILTRVKSMDTLESDLDGVLDNLFVPPAMAAMEYLIQVIVTDGVTTYVVRPGNNIAGTYEAIDISDNPKLTNFRWVPDATVVRTALQNRPTGVERWNMMPCPLEELRFTKAYEAPDRLSEFIGIDDTTKGSSDEELTVIYNKARALYLDRERDGMTWQTMHSVVYGANGMEHLWIQENWDKDYEGSGIFKAVSVVQPPERFNSYGETGQIAITDKHIYVCTGLNLWKRAALMDIPRRVGGKIFYIDETATGSEYTFYDQNERVIQETDIAVGTEPYYYTVSGTPTKDKYYCFWKSAVTLKKWTYQNSAGEWVYNSLGTTDGIGAGRANTNLVMTADNGAYVTYNNTVWNALKAFNDNLYGGCDDWYCGSKAELEALRLAVDREGDPLTTLFSNTYIWSSFENSATYAWSWYHPSQIWSVNSKYSADSLVPVRSF